MIGGKPNHLVLSEFRNVRSLGRLDIYIMFESSATGFWCRNAETKYKYTSEHAHAWYVFRHTTGLLIAYHSC